MAKGDSIVSICNIGLIALGEDPIADIDAPYQRAILMKARYDGVRRALLEAFPWRFAKAYADLAIDLKAPAVPGWDHAYELPSDYIRMFDAADDTRPRWEILGHRLYANDGAPFRVVYVRDETDTTLMSPLFCQLLGLSLAEELCEPITQSTEKLSRLQTRREALRASAVSASSQQSSSNVWDNDVLLRSRA